MTVTNGGWNYLEFNITNNETVASVVLNPGADQVVGIGGNVTVYWSTQPDPTPEASQVLTDIEIR